MKHTLFMALALCAPATAHATANTVPTDPDAAVVTDVPAQPTDTAVTTPQISPETSEANLPALQDIDESRKALGLFFDANVGTQGIGFDLGYEFNRYVKMRCRASWMDFKYSDEWNDMDLEAQFHNNSLGLLVDVHPFGGKFRISAGLNFAPLSVKANGTMDAAGYRGEYSWGGYDYRVDSGKGTVHGEYKWDRVQPYLGIGWSSDGSGTRSLYFHCDLGVNFIGKGNFTVSSSGDVQQRPTGSGSDWKPVNNGMLRDAFMKEGKDFFDIADKIIVYPVLQFGMGYRF